MQRLRVSSVAMLTFALALALFVPTSSAHADAPHLVLRPTTIAVGESASLRIELSGERAPSVPAVDGLRIEPSGESSELRSINGVTTQRRYQLYRVRGERAGEYELALGAEKVHLVVDAQGMNATASRSATPAPAATTSDNSLAFLRMSVPRRRLYVGQVVPITIKAYFRPGSEVTLAGLPTTGLGAFTIGHMAEQPQQSVETVGGTPYRVAAWTAELAAALPGNYVTHATLPVVIRYREAAPNPFARQADADTDEDDDAFGSSSLFRSFMNRSSFPSGIDDMFGRIRQRELTLTAPAQPLEVNALPAVGRPADFNGAIGHFTVAASVSPARGTAFEPLRLRIEVTGNGNFDRVSAIGLDTNQNNVDWRAYPPTTVVTKLGKVFEQAIVPQHDGQLVVPAIAFSYFDPEKQAYESTATAPIVIAIAPNPAAPPSATTTAATTSNAVATPLPTPTSAPTFKATLAHLLENAWARPLHRQPWFWMVFPFSFVIVGLGFLFWMHRHSGTIASPRARRRALRALIARERGHMRQALAANDAREFFAAAQHAIMESLAARWQQAPHEITAAAVLARMGDGAFAQALAIAEGMRYGGVRIDPQGLAEIAERVQTELGASTYRF